MVIAIIAILAAILFPVFQQAKAAAKKTACLSNLKQIGLGMTMYVSDYDDRLPDRRDLKQSLPGGYRPWTSWPPSDPRCGWLYEPVNPYIKNVEIGKCPVEQFRNVVQVEQTDSSGTFRSNYWMWRFDRFDDPVPLDNFWGKTEQQAVNDLRAANNPQAGQPEGPADAELMVDPYFPKTIPSVLADLKGKTPHFGGRNRLFLDGHAKFLRDVRTN